MQNIAVAAAGLELRALADGPRGLADSEVTIGGLIGPRWLALGPGQSAYLLDTRGVVQHFDCLAENFAPLVGALGCPSNARAEIAVGRRFLAVIEAEELYLFALGSLAPVARLDKGTTGGIPVSSVALGPGGPIALDDDGRLWRRTAAGWGATPIAGVAGKWRRVAVDRSGAVYVLVETADVPLLVEVGADGRRIAEVQDRWEVAGRFDAAPTRDAPGQFLVSFLPRPVQRDPDAPARVPEGDPPSAVPTYERAGTWTSLPLDSGIHRCRWHRVEIAAGLLPVGATVRLSTACSDEATPPAGQEFATVATLRGPFVADAAVAPTDGDALIGMEGRHLWVRLDLTGDGSATPRVDGLKLYYPRVSALDDLPAVFSADAESRELLERMLAVFQTTWEGLDVTIAELPRYFDPATIPEGGNRDRALARLAAWLAVRVEGDWSADHLRRVIAAEGGIAPRRGTLAALRQAIALAVSGLPGAPSDPGAELPAIIEGYTQRERLVLGSARTAGLRRVAPLAAASEDGRLRLGEDRLGQARVMAGPGSPEAELLARYAHRFSVSLPATWVKSEAAESMLRRSIDAERPAHVGYDLCLVEPRLRVGVQAAIGVDTIIAGPVRTVLTSADPDVPLDPTLRPPPSRQAHGRLGLDTVLAASDDLPDSVPGGAAPGTRRVGLDAVLA